MKDLLVLSKAIEHLTDDPDDAYMRIEVIAELEDLRVDVEGRIEDNERRRNDIFATKKDKEGRYKYR